MYKCKECGHLFEYGEQAVWHESHGEKWQGCPLCKGNYEEVKICDVCDEYSSDISYGMCKKCRDYTVNRFNLIIEKNFTNEEREFLNEAVSRI